MGHRWIGDAGCMKIFAIMVVGLLAGFLVGGLSPQAKLKAVKAELESVKTQLKEQRLGRGSAMGGVTRMLDIPEAEEASLKSRKNRAEVEEKDGEQAGADTNVTPDSVEAEDSKKNDREGRSLRNRIEVAAEAWGVRSALARDNFIDQNDLREEQALRFDVLIEAMNIRIKQSVNNLVVSIKAGEVYGEEAGVRVMNEVSDAMVITYDELDRNMPEGWRESSENDFSLTTLIDPEVAMPLTEVEDRVTF